MRKFLEKFLERRAPRRALARQTKGLYARNRIFAGIWGRFGGGRLLLSWAPRKGDALRRTSLLFESFMKKHLYICLVGQPLPAREFLSGLEIGYRQSHGHCLQRESLHRK